MLIDKNNKKIPALLGPNPNEGGFIHLHFLVQEAQLPEQVFFLRLTNTNAAANAAATERRTIQSNGFIQYL